jgi:phage gp46-like protein
MAVDFAIEISGSEGKMTFVKTATIMNNVYLSLMVERGSFFQNPDFGSRLHLLKRSKNTEKTAALARAYCREALQWLKDIGRATDMEIATEIDKTQDPCRLKILVEVTEASGQKVSFTLFKEVV